MLWIMIVGIIGVFISPVSHFIEIRQKYYGKKISFSTKIRICLLFIGAFLAAVVIGFQYSHQQTLEAKLREEETRAALNAFHLGVEARPYVETRIIKDELEQELGGLELGEWHQLLLYLQNLEQDVKAYYWALGLHSPSVEEIGSPTTVKDMLKQFQASWGSNVANWFAVGFYSRFAMHRVALAYNRPFKTLYKYRKVSELNYEGTQIPVYTPEEFGLYVIDTLDTPPFSVKPIKSWIEDFEKAADNVALPKDIVVPYVRALSEAAKADLERAFNAYARAVEKFIMEEK